MNPVSPTAATPSAALLLPSECAPRLGRRVVAGAALLAAVLGAGCAQVSKVADGPVTVGQRIVVTADRPWNQFEGMLSRDAAATWTQDGVTVDALSFYAGVRDGELLAPTPREPKGLQPLTFRAAMTPRQVVGLFEALYARAGSGWTLERLEPATFLGGDGLRFEFTLVRQIDDVRLRGLGWATVRGGELHAITYVAPRLAFFDRHRPAAEAVVASARLR